MSAAALAIVIASLVLVGAAVAAMAVGVMFKRTCLRGSCGGAAVRGAQGEHLSCSNCPNRKPRMGGRPPPQ